MFLCRWRCLVHLCSIIEVQSAETCSADFAVRLTGTGLIYLFVNARPLGISEYAAALIVLIGVFPVLILWLGLLQLQFHELGRSLRIIGDITYATYLTHFPLQLLVVIIINAYGS